MFGRDKPAPNSQAQPAAAHHYAPPPPVSTTASTKIETIVGPNCLMNGILQSDGGIRIEGIFDGQIMTTGNLIIADTAKVIAEVQAYNVVISGSLKGNITANRVEITESGKLWGDLNVNSMLLNEGAYLHGQTNMGGDVEPPMIEAPKMVAPKLVNADELDSANP